MRQRKHIATLLVLGTFFAWQLSAVVHLLIVPHEVCEHGKIIDSDVHAHASHGNAHHHKNAHHHEDDPDHGDESNSNHEGCGTLTFLTMANTVLSENVLPDYTAQIDPEETPVVFNEAAHHCGEKLFSLSPSNSPPSAIL